jgi:uncharacterized protein YodC (DUF2158 family)
MSIKEQIMVKDEEIKEGDTVILKSGSPTMIVVTVPQDPNKKIGCVFWNQSIGDFGALLIEKHAIETAEAFARRQGRLSFLAQTGLDLPETGPDKTLILTFANDGDRENFLRDFQAYVEERKEAGKSVPVIH